jgi:hypothetical protein
MGDGLSLELRATVLDVPLAWNSTEISPGGNHG